MTRIMAFLLVICLVFCLPISAHGVKQTEPPLILISIDGLSAELFAKTRPHFLTKLAQQGQACTTQTVFPSATLPGHIAMLTGREPSDELSGDVSLAHPVTTVLDEARQKGLTVRAIVAKEKAKLALLTGIDTAIADRVDQTLEFFKRYLGDQPDLIFVHFADVDIAGHQFGWCSEQQTLALLLVDNVIREMINMSPESTVIMTSDHGGHGHSHGTSMESDMRIPWIIAGPDADIVKPGDIKSVCDTAGIIRRVLGLDSKTISQPHIIPLPAFVYECQAWFHYRYYRENKPIYVKARLLGWAKISEPTGMVAFIWVDELGFIDFALQPDESDLKSLVKQWRHWHRIDNQWEYGAIIVTTDLKDQSPEAILKQCNLYGEVHELKQN